MSILSDVYIAREDEALKYDTAPETFTERAQFRRMTPLEYSMLWAVMRGAKWDVAAMDGFTCLLVVDGGERLIHSFPAAMLAAFGQLTSDQIREIAVKWAATDELACPPADIQPVIEALVRLARSATTSGRGLYLWNCV